MMTSRSKVRRPHRGGKEICEHCGASMMEYRLTLTKTNLRGMFMLLRAGGGPLRKGNIGFKSDSQYTNFTHLEKWGLIRREDVGEKQGVGWSITELGYSFLRAEVRVQEHVWIFRNAVQGYEGEMRTIQELADGWMYKSDYQQHQRPHRRDDLER
jgi:hypothetical protein